MIPSLGTRYSCGAESLTSDLLKKPEAGYMHDVSETINERFSNILGIFYHINSFFSHFLNISS